MPYSDFHKYVKELQLCFSQWSQDSSNLLSPDFFGPFGPSFSVSPVLFQSVIDFLRGDVCDKSIVKHALQIVSSKCLIVLERQVCDFLTGSLSVIDKDKEEILKQYPLTNLVGSFGDLDYDFNRRANCSMLNRSALHVIKRNKTASSYIACKTKEQRSKLFSVARKRSREVQKDFKTYGKEVSLQIKQRMVENQEKKMNKYIDDLQKNSELMKQLDMNGGVCSTIEEVDILLERLSSSKESSETTLEVLKDQIPYYKTLRGAKNLDMNGTLTEIVERLKTYLNSL